MPAIAIIGAGPAGSIAAIILARHGFPITLIEQHRFPRDKVCGECLSSVGIDVLNRLGFEIESLVPRPIPLKRALFHTTGGLIVEVELPRPMLGISRAALDTWLLESAKAAGATVLQPCRCEGREGPVLRVRDLQSNQFIEIPAEFVLVADGKSSLLGASPNPTDDFGLKAHFEGIEAARDAIGIFGVRGHYGGIAPIECGAWNISFSVPRRRIAGARGDFDALFAQIAEENVSLSEQMRRAQRTSEWLVSPLPRFGVRHDWPEHTAPIGNAAAAIEPIGGEGIGLAMRSAELAASALITGDVSADALQREYSALWNNRQIACRSAARVVSSPFLSRAAAKLWSQENPLIPLFMNWVGKTATE